MREIPVEHCQRQIARWNEGEQCSQDKKWPLDSLAVHRVKQQSHYQESQKSERAEIRSSGMSHQITTQTLFDLWLITKALFENAQAGIDEVIADMFSGFCFIVSCLGRKIDGSLRDVE